MKLKCTNVLVTIAMIWSALAMAVNLFIYLGPQQKIVHKLGMYSNIRVFDIRFIICPILTFLLYIFACVVTRRSENKRVCFSVCTLALVGHMLLKVLDKYAFESTMIRESFFSYGSEHMAVVSTLYSCRDSVERPLQLLAIVFLAMVIGTLCGKNNMQQAVFDGDSMRSMQNDGYNTQSMQYGGYGTQPMPNSGYNTPPMQYGGYSTQPMPDYGYDTQQVQSSENTQPQSGQSL